MKFAYFESLTLAEWTKENILSALSRKYRKPIADLGFDQYQLEQLQVTCLESKGRLVPSNEKVYGLEEGLKLKDLTEQLKKCPKFIDSYNGWKIGDFCYVNKNSLISITKENLIKKCSHINEVFYRAKIKTIRQRVDGTVFLTVNREYKVIPYRCKNGDIKYNISNKGTEIMYGDDKIVDYEEITDEKEYIKVKEYIEFKETK